LTSMACCCVTSTPPGLPLIELIGDAVAVDDVLDSRHALVPRFSHRATYTRAAFRQPADLDELVDEAAALAAVFVRRGLIGLARVSFVLPRGLRFPGATPMTRLDRVFW
jgi:hypothetical protein